MTKNKKNKTDEFFRTCKICKKEKRIESFADGRLKCFACHSKKYNEKRRALRKAKTQKCIVCKETKELLHFAMIRPSGFRAECKPCFRAMSKEKCKPKDIYVEISPENKPKESSFDSELRSFLGEILIKRRLSEVDSNPYVKAAIDKMFCNVSLQVLNTKNGKVGCKMIKINSHGYRFFTKNKTATNPYENF